MFISERPLSFGGLLWGLLVLLSYNDLKSYRLPNLLNAAVLLCGIFYTLYIGQSFWLPIISFSIATSILLATAYLYHKIRDQHGMGMGDVKLFAAGAVWLHPTHLPLVLFFASAAGILGYYIQNTSKSSDDKSARIAFGPYLAGAIWIVWLFGEKIFLAIS